MPKHIYDKKTKKSILDAVKKTRKSGGSWKEALEVSHENGYKGTLESLMQFVAPKAKAKRGSGRPKGSKNRAKAPPAAASHATAGIAGMIDALVQSRVSEVLERAIEVLKKSL